MNLEVWRPSDNEVYCYLKYHLPEPYSIESEPDTSYFSESRFCYRVLDSNKQEIRRLSGSFDEMEPGKLAAQADTLLQELRMSR